MHARTTKLIYSIISLHAQNGLTYNSTIRCALPTLVPIKTLYVNFKSITREHVEFSALERGKASLRIWSAWNRMQKVNELLFYGRRNVVRSGYSEQL